MIYVNGRFLTQPMTGVERYAYSICRAMAKLRQPFAIVCPNAPVRKEYDTRDMNIVHYGFGRSHFWEQCILPFYFVGKKDALVLSFTGLGSVLIRNKIMTVHDLSFLENPSWFSKAYYWWYKLMTPLAVRTSKHIITVSQFSKQEIQRFYPFLKEEDISVVYCAVDEDRFYTQAEKTVPAERFALAVSSLDPRKNFDRLIEAFKHITNCQLYIVGKQGWVFSRQDGTEDEVQNVRFLGRVDDEELLHLYNTATCFIFPSIYEGFGMPPVEAMACGCPVLASDIPVLREVCGDAAMYFNPYGVDHISEVIRQYLEHSDVYRNRMQGEGYRTVKRFSWEKSAKEVIRLVKSQKCG